MLMTYFSDKEISERICHHQGPWTIKNAEEEFLHKKNDSRQKCDSIQRNEEVLKRKFVGKCTFSFLFLKGNYLKTKGE